MEDEEEMSTPFWLQSHDGHRRRLRRSYSLFLSSGALIVFLLVTACVVVFIIVPTLLSFTSNIFKPQLVKKGWDSLNLVLVLFAIVCGFLSRNSNETPRSYEDRSFSEASPSREHVESDPETPTRPWYMYSEPDGAVHSSFNRLRSFNSYPDLRRESYRVAGHERWRFYDDTHVSSYRGSELDDHRQIRHRRSRSEAVGEEEQDVVKNIAVDTFVVRATEVPSAPPLPETQPPPSPPSSLPRVAHTKCVRRNANRTYRATGKSEVVEKEENNELKVRDFEPPPSMPEPETRPSPPQGPPTKGVRKNAQRTYHGTRQAEMIEKEENNELEIRNFQPPPSTPPPPPPSSPPSYLPVEKKTDHGKKKRVSATKDFLTSLRGKKKKQRHRSVENFESILASQASQPPLSTQITPPPPPPPPPPSVFHNLFSSGKPKHKKPHSAPLSPHVSSSRASKTHKPLISNKREIFLDDTVITGNESPLIPIPPPPPPFKMPAWKFRVQGDFVRVDSIRSSRSSSPDLDEGVDSPTSEEQSKTTTLSCPSPDVDTKADTFIARFRAGLKLEKMNSMKEKQGIGKSNLGPSSLRIETREETALD